MYTKTINDRQIFSDCKAIELNGRWISNPTLEMIAEAGWELFEPSEVEPQARTEPGMDEILNAVKKMLSPDTINLSDEDALAVAALYPTWLEKLGMSVSVGDRLWYDGKLYKVVQSHTVQSDWTPDNAASLYTEVSIEEFPEWKQPTGAQDAYNTGDRVSYNGKHWESLIDGNTWAPDAYPAGWKEI